MGLLRLLRDHPDAVEADLSRYHHLDLRDRRRYDEHGRRALTLTMIRARVYHLPPESAVATIARGGKPEWRLEHILLAHLWQVFTGQPHPMFAAALAERVEGPRRARRVADAQKRSAARRRRLGQT